MPPCSFFMHLKMSVSIDKERGIKYNGGKTSRGRIFFMKPVLYGDGIHDDTAAIQALIDEGKCEVSLPAPEKFYLISSTLVLPSNFTLRLPRFAEIRLAKGSNCRMVEVKMRPAPAKRIKEGYHPYCYQIWAFVDDYSDAEEDRVENISIIGGIWNYNNREQLSNPEQKAAFRPADGEDPHGYTGDAMLFYNVRNLTLSGLTVKDPVHYGVTLDRVTDFTVEDVTFDYNLGNPIPLNMDGIHLNGNCHRGVIRNLKGACYDDLVALNAHEGSAGDITDILVDGLYAEGCHSAVRLLTVGEVVKNIHITNVFGTYYQYTIALSKHYAGETTGYYDGITLDNIYAAKAPRLEYFKDLSEEQYPTYAPIYIASDVVVKHLKIDTYHRREYNVPVETIRVRPGATVERLQLSNMTLENHTGREFPFLVNQGEIRTLRQSHLVVDHKEITLRV